LRVKDLDVHRNVEVRIDSEASSLPIHSPGSWSRDEFDLIEAASIQSEILPDMARLRLSFGEIAFHDIKKVREPDLGYGMVGVTASEAPRGVQPQRRQSQDPALANQNFARAIVLSPNDSTARLRTSDKLKPDCVRGGAYQDIDGLRRTDLAFDALCFDKSSPVGAHLSDRFAPAGNEHLGRSYSR